MHNTKQKSGDNLLTRRQLLAGTAVSIGIALGARGPRALVVSPGKNRALLLLGVPLLMTR
jgi:hypothetical protein